MSETRDGGPAFPVSRDPLGPNEGMSLRDYFAGKALAGWLASFPEDAKHPALVGSSDDAIAKASYMLADSMLREREK